MARVTVEDCVLKVPNRFELVLLAAQRARDITAGAPISLDRDNDKNPVVALREIADETVQLDQLQNAVITGMQKQGDIEVGNQQWPIDLAKVSPEDDTASVDEEMQEDMLEVAEDEVTGLDESAL